MSRLWQFSCPCVSHGHENCHSLDTYTAGHVCYAVTYVSDWAVHGTILTTYVKYTKLYCWVYGIYCWVYCVFWYLGYLFYYLYVHSWVYNNSVCNNDVPYYRKGLA